MSPGLPRAVFVEPNDGCLTACRALARRGVEVVVLAGPTTAYVADSRLVRGIRLPAIAAGSAPWVAALERLGAEGEGVLLSGSDGATELLQRERHRIPSVLRSFETADGPHLRFMAKTDQHAVAERVGVRVPWSHHLTAADEVRELARSVEYPCIVKPVLSHVGKELGGLRTLRVDSLEELLEVAERPLRSGIEVLVTEHVPGGEERLEGAVTIRLGDGSYPLAYGRRKLRQHPADYGVGTLHQSWDAPDAVAMARTLLDAVDFVGISILEGKRHARTGELVLIEVNVRVPGGYGLSEACGVDGAWRLYATAAGLPLEPQPTPRVGAKCVLPHLDALAVAHRLRSRELGLRGALASYRGVRDAGVLDLRDPTPAFSVGAQMIQARRRKRSSVDVP